MNEQIKKAYLDKMSAQVKEWGAQVDLVKAKIATESAGVRVDYQTHIENWHKKEGAMKQQMDELRAAGADKFDVIKANVQNVWSEMNILMKSIGDKK